MDQKMNKVIREEEGYKGQTEVRGQGGTSKLEKVQETQEVREAGKNIETDQRPTRGACEVGRLEERRKEGRKVRRCRREEKDVFNFRIFSHQMNLCEYAVPVVQ